MMKPSAIRAAILNTLTAQFPAMTVEAHGGFFTEREMPFLLAKAPALLLGSIGIANTQRAGPDRWRADLRWGLYVLGADSAETARDVVAMDVVFALHTWLPDQKWGIADARLPALESLKVDNLYTGHANNLRVALWALAWDQSFILTV